MQSCAVQRKAVFLNSDFERPFRTRRWLQSLPEDSTTKKHASDLLVLSFLVLNIQAVKYAAKLMSTQDANLRPGGYFVGGMLVSIVLILFIYFLYVICRYRQKCSGTRGLLWIRLNGKTPPNRKQLRTGVAGVDRLREVLMNYSQRRGDEIVFDQANQPDVKDDIVQQLNALRRSQHDELAKMSGTKELMAKKDGYSQSQLTEKKLPTIVKWSELEIADDKWKSIDEWQKALAIQPGSWLPGEVEQLRESAGRATSSYFLTMPPFEPPGEVEKLTNRFENRPLWQFFIWGRQLLLYLYALSLNLAYNSATGAALVDTLETMRIVICTLTAVTLVAAAILTYCTRPYYFESQDWLEIILLSSGALLVVLAAVYGTQQTALDEEIRGLFNDANLTSNNANLTSDLSVLEDMRASGIVWEVAILISLVFTVVSPLLWLAY